MGSPGRVPILPPVPTGKGKGSEPSESKSIIAALKPKPGKVKVGKAKKRSSSNVELCLSHTKNSEVPHHLLQSSSPPRGPSPVHRSITHSTSVPLHPVPNRLGRLPKESVHLKTYVAMSDYQSQDDGCLSFQAGDKCVLLRKTNDGWWLVNIGGREGWTPEGFWKEEAWVSHVVCTPHSICHVVCTPHSICHVVCTPHSICHVVCTPHSICHVVCTPHSICHVVCTPHSICHVVCTPHSICHVVCTPHSICHVVCTPHSICHVVCTPHSICHVVCTPHSICHVVCTPHSICSSHDDTVHVAVTVVAKQFLSHNMNYNLVAATVSVVMNRP